MSTASDAPMIRVCGLTKRFGGFLAVDDVSLEVERGTIFAFLGTNGAGKTTTIRMMTDVIEPTSGTVEIGGYRLDENPIEAKFLMGVIPDRPYLYGKLTAREYLQFMADIYRVKHRTARERIEQLLSDFGLFERQYDLVETYSHGMKQRLALCGSLIHNPPLLIVDEPMVGLDPRGARLLKDTFRERCKAGLTIFMSTHSLSVAEEIADKLAIIKRGKIVAEGNLQEIFSKVQDSSHGLEEVFLQIISDEDGASGAGELS